MSSHEIIDDNNQYSLWAQDCVASIAIVQDEDYPIHPDSKELAQAILSRDSEISELREKLAAGEVRVKPMIWGLLRHSGRKAVRAGWSYVVDTDKQGPYLIAHEIGGTGELVRTPLFETEQQAIDFANEHNAQQVLACVETNKT